MASSSGPAKPAVGLEAGTVPRAKVAVLGARAPPARLPPPGPPPRWDAGRLAGKGSSVRCRDNSLISQPGGGGRAGGLTGSRGSGNRGRCGREDGSGADVAQ